MRHLFLLAAAVLSTSASTALCADGPKSTEVAPTVSPEHAKLFESQIKPILARHCFQCHSHAAGKDNGGLMLDARGSMLVGGDSGAALVPGKPEESLLIEALRHEGLEMPPEQKLDDAVIADFETWVRGGAFWPAGDRPVAAALGDQAALFAQAKTHWAFQPVRKPEPPAVRDAAWAHTPIDRFILAKLEAKGLQPSREADPAVLCRRVYFDLVGLPPSPEEVDAFVKAYSGTREAREQAYEALLDKLLASPHYGERWGRHWLDVARYADTRDFIAAGIDRRCADDPESTRSEIAFSILESQNDLVF